MGKEGQLARAVGQLPRSARALGPSEPPKADTPYSLSVGRGTHAG